MEIKGWRFKPITPIGQISFEDDRGVKYNSSLMSNSNKIIIHKTGTTRFLNFPKFVIEYIEITTREKLNNDELYVINKSK